MTEITVLPLANPVAEGPPSLPRKVYGLSVALSVVAAITAGLTYFVPGILLGPAAVNGNARGTALVMLVLAIPILLLAMSLVRRGSWRFTLVWLGALFYIGYNSFLFLFLTPFNRLFLLYVGSFSLALFASIAFVSSIDSGRLVERLHRVPMRGLAAFIWTVVVLNALAWLRTVVPALFAEDPGSFLEGTGVATNALYVQDLSFWLPGVALAAWWMWRRRPVGVLLTGSWVAFGILEGIGVAVDQWYGVEADPTSSVASEGAIVVMAVSALISAIAFYFYVRRPRIGEKT